MSLYHRLMYRWGAWRRERKRSTAFWDAETLQWAERNHVGRITGPEYRK